MGFVARFGRSMGSAWVVRLAGVAGFSTRTVMES